MEGHRLILNDGTVIENGTAGLSNEILWLWIPGTFWDIADVVRNAEAMQNIVYQYGEMEERYEGYTVCTGIMADGERIAVRMVKG